MKNRLFLPVALAALTTGTGFLAISTHAQAQQRRQEQAPRAQQFRFEFKNDGTGPRFFKNGQEMQNPFRAQGGNEGVQDNPLDLLRKLMEEAHGNPGERSPRRGNQELDELFKQFDEGNQNAPDDKGGSPLNPQKLMEEMLRRMGGGAGGGGGRDRLGFGPGAREELPRTSKHHLSALAEWRSLVAQARQSTVRVLKKNTQVALATVVSADGYALTKASEVEEGEIEVEFTDGRIVAAKVVDVMKAYDLALIKLEATGLTPAKFAETDTPVGTLIAAVSTGEDPTGVGIISVAARSLDERSKGFLGIRMDPENAPPAGVRIMEVIDGGAAKRAGLVEGDVILSVNGEKIENMRQLQKLVTALKPDQKVKVKIEREGKAQEIELSLGNRGEAVAMNNGMDQRMFDQTAQMGSSLSRNASGYPNAVQSDLALQAEDAGGPVIDVTGAIVGLNIARAERVSTFLIPGRIVNAMLTDVQSGKFSLSKDADTLNSELREINATIQKAQDAMKKAEQERDAALKALEKIQKK
jgi:serine protease Do